MFCQCGCFGLTSPVKKRNTPRQRRMWRVGKYSKYLPSHQFSTIDYRHQSCSGYFYSPTGNEPKVKSVFWRLINGVGLSVYGKVWRANNKERVSSNNKSWKKLNRDRVKKLNQDYYYRHPGRQRAATRNWSQHNPEKASKLSRVHGSRRRALQRESAENFTQADIDRRLFQQNGKCAVCKKKITEQYHIDHIIPLSRGGSNAAKNIQLLCPGCNLKKGHKNPEDFMQEMGFLL